MKKLIALVFCYLSAIFATANDGVFYASGNQLIPIIETEPKKPKGKSSSQYTV